MLIKMTADELKAEYQKSTILSAVLITKENVIGSIVEYESHIHILNPMIIDIMIDSENRVVPYLRAFNIASGERYVKINKQNIICMNHVNQSVEKMYDEYIYNEFIKIAAASTKNDKTSLDNQIQGMTKQ